MTKSDDWGRPDGLVEAAWLVEHLNDSSVKIVEATFTLPGVSPTGYERYVRAHIPNAVFYDIEKIGDPDNPLPHMLPSDADFAAAMGRLGIENDHHVVVYDAFGLSSAPRAWWMLRAYGHHNVRILNGGLAHWQAQGRPVTAEIPASKVTQFSARLDRARVCDKTQMLANLTSRQAQVVDARSAGPGADRRVKNMIVWTLMGSRDRAESHRWRMKATPR